MTQRSIFALNKFTDHRPHGRFSAKSFFPTSLLSTAAVNKKILLLRNDARERRALSLLLVDAGFQASVLPTAGKVTTNNAEKCQDMQLLISYACLKLMGLVWRWSLDQALIVSNASMNTYLTSTG